MEIIENIAFHDYNKVVRANCSNVETLRATSIKRFILKCCVGVVLSCFFVNDSFAVSSNRMAGTNPVIKTSDKNQNNDESENNGEIVTIKPVKKPSEKDKNKKQSPNTQSTSKTSLKNIPKFSMQEIIATDSLGILELHDKGFLGNDVWYEASRDEVIKILKRDLNYIKSPLIADLFIRLMSSQANAGLMKDYSDAKSPELFALKIKRLQDLGRFESASLLYSKNNNYLYNLLLLENGVTAMIGNGEIAKACLDIFASDDFYSKIDNEFINNVGYLCTIYGKNLHEFEGKPTSRLIKKLVSDKSYKITLGDAKSLPVKYNRLEISAAFALGRVDFVDVEAVDFSELPSFVLGLIIDSGANIPPEWKFLAIAESIVRGERDIGLIDQFFEGEYRTHDKDTAESNKSDLWIYRIIEIYRDLVNVSFGEGQAEFVFEAFDITPKRYHKILKPFMVFVKASKADIYSLEPEKLVFLASMILSLQNRLPDDWREELIKITDLQKSDDKNKIHASMLLVADDIIANRNIEKSIENILQYSENDFEAFNEKEIALFWALVQPFLQKNSKKSVYDKFNDLTFDDNYVMYEGEFLEGIKNSISGKSAGMVILYVAYMANSSVARDLDPIIASNIVKSFRAVGLNNEARRFCVEAITGLN